jgi:SAM-dependent methyltransferase
MASSQKTYDLFLRHSPTDRGLAAALARKLRRSGLRPCIDWCGTALGSQQAEETKRRTAMSRIDVWIMGPSSLPYWMEQEEEFLSPPTAGSTIILLLPGFPLSPTHLPPHLTGCRRVDMRMGIDDGLAWAQLCATVDELRLQTELIIDPSYALGTTELKDRTKRSYDGIAEKFASQWFEHPPALAIEKLLRLLPRRSAVLDAGCGPGHHAKFIAQNGHDVLGVDFSYRMLQIARKAVHGARFERMRIENLKFLPETFDAIWCAGAALHIPREETVHLLRGYRRVLRPNGVLGLNLQVGRQSEVVAFGEDQRFFQYYEDMGEVAALLRRSGFSIVDWDYAETARNTHELDLTLRWATLYAKPDHGTDRATSGFSDVEYPFTITQLKHHD